MGGHQIICQEELVRVFDAKLVKQANECFEPLTAGFAHELQDRILHVFGCDFELTGEMILQYFLQIESTGFVITENQVVPDAGSDEDFADARQALGLRLREIHQAARNSFQASFLPPAEKQRLMDELDAYIAPYLAAPASG